MKSIITNIKITKNPFILFFPFLILYLILILIFAINQLSGDEGRYLMYAKNLSRGFYSPPPPAIDLGNGPGYPLLIMPFVALNLPLIFIKLLNALLYYLSIVLLFKSLQHIVPIRFTIIFSLIWALYPTFYVYMSNIVPETLAAFLITLILFLSFNIFRNVSSKKMIKYIILAGLTLGYLALTKPVFGYVIMFMVAGLFLLFITNRKNKNYKKTISIFIIAFITTIPYLAYTYHLSGKMFYWSSFGGNNLYWMSSPYEGEYGDWMGFPVIPNNEYRIPGSDSLITLRHQKDFDELLLNEEVRKANVRNGEIEYNLTKGIAQDDLLKKIAVRNIKSNPIKFIENCISNAGRMIFNYPGSYVLQKPSTLRRLPINGTLLVISFFCLILTFLKWNRIVFPIRFLLFFGLIYFGGSLFGSAEDRMFLLVVPILLIWIAYIISKSVKIKLDW
jgi:4-amino-4-deoxy-L-arabinose transferase-like glycosyltransferase